ncbi:MAG TPA: acetylornithine/succinylornithine family transaminase [Longimicrobiales bacterium]|nr:acetylornithine/succinylornithine family transaminase [Longimicrobiales bacterium]
MALTVEELVSRTTQQSVLGTYRRAEPVFVAGRGCRLIDDGGREYIDLTAGIGVNAFGYGDAGIATAMVNALDTGLVHISNLYRNRPGEELAAELTGRSFADRVFFCNSGGEANEAAIKFSRRRAREVGGPQKHEIVALRGSFHGRLFGSLAITDRPAWQQPFEPLMPGAVFAEANLDAVRAVVSAERTAAIFAEPVQGEGGVVPLSPGFLAGLRGIADDADALLVFDEVQCGLGRTGHAFAYEASGVEPDILTLAKPLAGGLPMGAVLLTESVASKVKPGDHATTFGGGPLVASVALNVVRRVCDAGLLDNVRERGEQVRRVAESWISAGLVSEVRGAGLMLGLVVAGPAAPVVAGAIERGLLVLTAGERVVRLLPPLVIEEAELAAALDILGTVLRETITTD